MMGITVLCASGDQGSSDGEPTGKPRVDFPASSPWVLACGGTSLQAAGGQWLSESAWSNTDGATGGGVSSFFSLPEYQRSAGVPVSVARPKFAGRGVPDVSGCADPKTGYRVFGDGQDRVVGGTSAVAPLWAGLIALLNQKLGTRVGYINPLLYSTLGGTKAFNDVASGANGDFSSQTGWDPCTGVGTPNGAEILRLLQKIQQEQACASLDLAA
jgi:kumamolisin